jgi:cyclopropane fatty-acyl-phospholipid synthase-like methyltransferase
MMNDDTEREFGEIFEEYDEVYFEGKGAKAYHSYEEARGIVRELFAIILKMFRGEIKTALDIGCAYGFSVEYLLQNGVDAYGCEPSAYALARAKRYWWGERIFKSYLPKLTGVDRRFDLVTAMELLEHIPEKYAKDSIKRIFEVCDKYAVMVIAFTKHFGHINLKPREWWEALFRELGFAEFERKDIEREFSNHPTSKRMLWSGRFFVFDLRKR